MAKAALSTTADIVAAHKPGKIILVDGEGTCVEVPTTKEAARLVLDETHEPDISCAAEVYEACADYWFDHKLTFDDPDANACDLFPAHIYANASDYCDAIWAEEIANNWTETRGNGLRRMTAEELY